MSGAPYIPPGSQRPPPPEPDPLARAPLDAPAPAILDDLDDEDETNVGIVTSASALGAVQTVRNLIWQHGFRPMPVYSADHQDRQRAGKAPLGKDWEKRARQDPPECISLAATVAWAANTGVLCDGLRAIDLDIDDPGIAGSIRALAVTMLGATITRTRENSPRCLLVYRAVEGQPGKGAITGAGHGDGHACKIEVLGRGHQFVAYGMHPSGAALQWPEGGPADRDWDSCPAVSEVELYRFLNAAAALIGADPIELGKPKRKANGRDHGPPTAEVLDIAAALRVIPNAGAPDWESWNNSGLAIYAATEGSEAGRDLWVDWSAKNPADDPDVTLARWNHYATSPPNRTGAGRLFAMAVAASPGWRKPSSIGTRQERLDPDDEDSPPPASEPDAREHPFSEPGDPTPEPPPPGPKMDDLVLDPERTAAELSAATLLSRDITPPEPLLGSLITRSTRAFLVGPTGLGKTMMGYSIAAGMAAGGGFLHWRSARPCRVLVVDGEMPGDLVQARLRDALRRAGLDAAPAGLFFYSLDLVTTHIVKEYPTLGRNAPLCTDEGQRFVMALCAALQPDVVIFDNLMSLLGTAALDPDKWETTLPLVSALSANRIGQLWLDHTNRAGSQYGTGLKSWRFDTVGLMMPLESEERRGDDLAFSLSFEKARRRTPENRADYERVVIRLRDDRWTSEPADGPAAPQKIKPSVRPFYDALLDAIAATTRAGETTKAAWQSECQRKGLIPATGSDPTAMLRKAQFELIKAAWIGIDGDRIFNLRFRG